MNIVVNGEELSFSFSNQTPSVIDLFAHLNLDVTGRIVEINATIIKPEHFSETLIYENDVVEIIQFMGGGA